MDHIDIQEAVKDGPMFLRVFLIAQGRTQMAKKLDCTLASLVVADQILTVLPRGPRLAFLVGANVGAVLQKNHAGVWKGRHFHIETGAMDPWSAVECKLKLGTPLVHFYALALRQPCILRPRPSATPSPVLRCVLDQ